jgi:crooked neck
MSAIKRKAEDEGDDKKQFTAATLLKSAYEASTNELKTVDFKIADLDELHYFQQRKRTEFENALRRNRFNYGQWMRYAQFEIDQKDLQRARSIFERALEVDYKNISMWVRYIQIEIKNKNINHARNLLERATKLLPRIDKLWYNYVTIEESIGNIVAVGEIFENWLQWKPVKDVWIHYIEFKERYAEYEDERLLFEKLVVVFNDSDSWIRWVEFEKKYGDHINVINVFKLGINSLFKNNKLKSDFLIMWMKYEYFSKQQGKVQELYKFGFKTLNEEESRKLQKFQTDFGKQYGVDTENIENYVLQKRKSTYKEKLKRDPQDYESWWMYLTLLMDSTLEISKDEVFETFSSAIEIFPISQNQPQWISFWYLNYRYALWEEFENKNIDNARNSYERLLKLIPHKEFTIVEFWIKFSEFELRNSDLSTMRKVLGQAIGLTKNEDIIKYYIEIEIKFKYFERARKLYDKLLELHPSNGENWINYFNFEESLGNDVRSYDILEIAIFEDFVDIKGKNYIISSVLDKLVENYNFKLARRLLEYKITHYEKNVDFMIERCLFELQVPTEEQIKAYNNEEAEFTIVDDSKNNVRKQYERFLTELKNAGDVKNRIVMLESLKDFEQQYGDVNRVENIDQRLPKIVRKVRESDEGINEEYIEYVFPEDEQEIQEQVEEFENEFFNAFDNENILDENMEQEQEQETDEPDGLDNIKTLENNADEAQKTFKSRFASDSEEDDDEDKVNVVQRESFSSRFEE